MAAVLGFSARQLAETNRALAERWQTLAVFVESFDLAAAAAVWDVGADQALEGLSELFARSMVRFDPETSRYRLHDLMRDVAQLTFEGQDGAALEARLEAARAEHAWHYCVVLVAAGDLYLKGGEGVLAGLAFYDLEQRNIAAGQAWAAANATRNKKAAALAAALGPTDGSAHVLALRLHPRAWIDWLDAQRKAYVRLGDRQGEGNALGNLGLAWVAIGEPRRAIKFLVQALAIAREIGDRRIEGSTFSNLGTAWLDLGEPRRAIESYEQALTIHRAMGDRTGEASDVYNSALALDDLGERAEAMRRAQEALAIFEAIGAQHLVETVRAQLAAWEAGKSEC